MCCYVDLASRYCELLVDQGVESKKNAVGWSSRPSVCLPERAALLFSFRFPHDFRIIFEYQDDDRLQVGGSQSGSSIACNSR